MATPSLNGSGSAPHQPSEDDSVRPEVVTFPRSPTAVIPPLTLTPLPPAPAVIILRGVSGSGKSSLAKHFQSLAFAQRVSLPRPPSSSFTVPPLPPPTTLICSADAFFTHRGVYRFDSKRLSEAHAHCLSHFLSLLSGNASHVIVDNTHIERWQYVNYARVAEMRGYAVHVVEVRVTDDFELGVCAERNQHGVPLPALMSQRDKWEEEPSATRIDPVWSPEEVARMRRRREERAQRAAEWAERQRQRDAERAAAQALKLALTADAAALHPPDVRSNGAPSANGGIAWSAGAPAQPPPQPPAFVRPMPPRGAFNGGGGPGRGYGRGGGGGAGYTQGPRGYRGGHGPQSQDAAPHQPYHLRGNPPRGRMSAVPQHHWVPKEAVSAARAPPEASNSL